MKLLKLIGLITIVSLTFIYTDKIIDASIEQDEIMIKINEVSTYKNITPKNATINDDTIIPGTKGKTINKLSSYKAMKKIGYYEESLLKYENIYPEISIYNNYNKYIVSGNTNDKSISLIYIINNQKNLDNLLQTNINNININIFIDSTYLNNNIQIINKLKDYNINIYNYGNNGKYTKDNIIITNNIINNKSNNESIFCLFINKDSQSLNNCANSKMLSIYIQDTNKLNTYTSGQIIIIDNIKNINYLSNQFLSKGFKIVYLNELIKE